MREYTEATTMIEEIRRDLAKSPVVVSSRVQATQIESQTHEALNYQYSIHADNMPTDHYDLAKLGERYFDSWSNVVGMTAWLEIEAQQRFGPLCKTSRYSKPSESFHPLLKGQTEGNHYSYTYRERMIGMLAAMESALAKDVYSRRAYWPIYRELDAHRASDLTRIPCTLGYHFAIRDVSLVGPQLHVTNYQRSCDFDRFFLSDLWFTHLAQKALAGRLDVDCGLIVHNILSFHAFIDKEVY